MLKRLFATLLLLALPSVAYAQVNGGAVLNVFTAGTVIVSADVNTNFSSLFTNALDRTNGIALGTLTVRTLLPVAASTYNLGSSGVKFQDAFFNGTVTSTAFAGSGTSLTNVGILNAVNTFTAANNVFAGLVINGGSTAAGAILKSATWGLIVTGITGSTYDLALTTPGNGLILSVPTGTANVVLAGSLAFGGGGAITSSSNVAKEDNINTFTGGVQQIQPNTATNPAALAFINTGGTGFVGLDDSTGATYGAGAYGATLYGPAAAGVTLRAAHASGPIVFKTGGNSARWGINAAGDFTFGTSAHLADSGGTPVITSGFDAGSSIAGTDYAFVVSKGTTGGGTTGLVTFGHTWSTTPVCTFSQTLTPQTNFVTLTLSTTTLSINYTANTSSENFNVLCRGY